MMSSEVSNTAFEIGASPHILNNTAEPIGLAQRLIDGVEFDGDSRHTYISWIKNLRQSEGDSNPEERKGLTDKNQSLLHQLSIVELIRLDAMPDKKLRGLLAFLEKVPLSLAIAEHIGHRPESVVFQFGEFDTVTPAIDRLLDGGAVYVKGNRGYRGEAVTRIVKSGRQYVFPDSTGMHRIVDDLHPFAAQLSKGYLPEDHLFIAEQEIPIARTASGRTWEARLLPSLGDDYAYCKVAAEGSDVNNISKGGQRSSLHPVLRDVIQAKFPDFGRSEVHEHVIRFENEANQLAQLVKDLTDEFQLQIARQIILPSDLKDQKQYDDVMRDCFAGNFLTVDITGSWSENGELIPSIIEAQTSAQLYSYNTIFAYQNCVAEMNRKIARLQDALV